VPALMFAVRCARRAFPLVVLSLALLGSACASVASAYMSSPSPADPATQADPASSASAVRDLPDSGTIEQTIVDAFTATSLPPQPARLAVPGDDRAGCTTDYLERSALGCVHGDPNGTRTVVLWGDSHVWMWLPAFDAIGMDAQTQIVEFSKSSCGPQDMRIWLERLRRAYKECDDFNRFVAGRIEALRPDVVVLTGGAKGVRLVEGDHGTAQGVEDAWAAGMASTIRAVAPFAGQTIVLGDIAYPASEPADCLSAHANDPHACDTPRSGAVDENGNPAGVFDDHNQREQQVAEQNGARYVSVTRWLCRDNVCPAVIGGLAVYRDYFHISPNYAYWLSNALGTATGLLR
jgi:hypothetical protein